MSNTPAAGHFHVLQICPQQVETGEVKERAILRREGISVSWSPCHSGCEHIKDTGQGKAAVACAKNAGLQGFHLIFPVLYQHIFSSIPRSLVLKNTGQDKIGISHY